MKLIFGERYKKHEMTWWKIVGYYFTRKLITYQMILSPLDGKSGIVGDGFSRCKKIGYLEVQKAFQFFSI
ncbi:conserved hypothetical protein [Marinobacter nauticus ATCC 49840]|nr:conserved hypothetical protein [Marinobacter nauticus ATCC 49840]